MGNCTNQRKRENQPKKEALDTNEDKGIEETKQSTEEAKPTEEKQRETEVAQAKKEEEAVETEEGEAEGVEEEKAETTEVEAAAEGETAAKAPEEAAPTEEEAEEKRPEEIPEEEIVEERFYTIPLSKAWISPRKKRAPRAVRIVKSFVQKHMKIETAAKGEEEEEEAGRLVVSDEVNQKLWSRGIEKPPRKIRVRAVKDKEGTVTLYLAEGD
jgi:large subunit ribosomal protein L31e